MEEKQVIIITTESQLENTLMGVIRRINKKPEVNFENEKLSRKAAAKLAGVSLPTLGKMIKAQIFPIHGFGRKQFLLREEVIEGLRKNYNE